MYQTICQDLGFWMVQLPELTDFIIKQNTWIVRVALLYHISCTLREYRNCHVIVLLYVLFQRVMGCSGGSADDSHLSFNTPHRPALNHSVCERSLNSSMAPHNTSLRPLTAAYKAKNDVNEVSRTCNTTLTDMVQHSRITITILYIQ
jgi:hypothetical protein